MNIETFFNNDTEKRFYFPGRIFIGSGVSDKAVELISKHDSVAIVVDCVFADSKLLDEIKEKFANKKCHIWVIEGAPFAQDVMSFIDQIGNLPEVVVSIGGGSAADFAKSIILYALFGSLEGVGVGPKLGLSRRADSIRPLYIAIPTTAGSGAESSRYYVTYDKITHAKVYGKTWEIVADWIFLDPLFLASMSSAALVGCAFDAFIHLFETLIAKHETSIFGEMFSLNGIPKIMNAIHSAVNEKQRNDFVHEQLLYGASLAGVAISNIRTGSIHEAAGALLELTTLSHAETLFVFFRTAIEQYLAEISSLEESLIAQLRLLPAFSNFRTLQDVMSWWEFIFHQVSLDVKITEAVSKVEPTLASAREHIFNRVYSDKVWVGKESPRILTEKDVWHLVDHSLHRFGITKIN
ncbi:iron-containing alcohol dehydrogenase [Polynucleobacter kasalickyi]|uniref:Alcohol dehydrogenase, class IV n=1 Tax=Polynucleobacter kasalickyi TaxID=1938817 RepID=A0A1W1Y1J2_9BURK|nr:iron-containing alcohol dehydrogenase [Polynucleobacter kasalickyi]SMC30080.1 Alcohol dehydrogenase, class IV [Polynucleobacter kasalickyi]